MPVPSFPVGETRLSPFVLIVNAAQEPPDWIGQALSALGCRTYTLELKPESVQDVSAAAPDLIVLHANGNAPASLAQLRALRSDSAVPIVVAGAGDSTACWEGGAADVLAWPATAAELHGRLGLHLALIGSREAERKLGEALQATMSHLDHLRVRLDHEAGPADAPAPPVPAGAAPLPKILLVDDSPANIHLLVQFLRDDYKTLAATSGPAALRIAQSEKPDLILLDVVMPDMDGHEICRQLKNDPRTEPIPVIFITGKNEVEDEMVGFELGAIDYIVKPFSLPLVQRRIRTHLDLKHYRDELERQSMLDAMTGIPNRRCFDQTLAQAWTQAAYANEPLSLVMIDIDHFKAYNDHGGHPAGDACLRRVANALAMAGLRSRDLVARYGGEEFACILPGADIAEAAMVAERMHAAIATLHIPHPSPAVKTLSLSLGAACHYPGTGTLPAGLLEAADQALYRAKQEGRNRVVRQA